MLPPTRQRITAASFVCGPSIDATYCLFSTLLVCCRSSNVETQWLNAESCKKRETLWKLQAIYKLSKDVVCFLHEMNCLVVCSPIACINFKRHLTKRNSRMKPNVDICAGSPEQKAQMIFEMYDLDHSGELNREEGSNMIRWRTKERINPYSSEGFWILKTNVYWARVLNAFVAGFLNPFCVFITWSKWLSCKLTPWWQILNKRITHGVSSCTPIDTGIEKIWLCYNRYLNVWCRVLVNKVETRLETKTWIFDAENRALKIFMQITISKPSEKYLVFVFLKDSESAPNLGRLAGFDFYYKQKMTEKLPIFDWS